MKRLMCWLLGHRWRNVVEGEVPDPIHGGWFEWYMTFCARCGRKPSA